MLETRVWARNARIVFVGLVGLVAFAPLAHAGIPRGAVLIADEQDADETTGITIARGHAEISVETQRINGRADTIELRPGVNQIVFKGSAAVSVGNARYEGDAVTCTLDFTNCGTSTEAAAAPSTAVPVQIPAAQTMQAPVAAAQAMPPPSGVGAAVTRP